MSETPQTFNAALAGSLAPHMNLSQHVGKHTPLPAGCVVYLAPPLPTTSGAQGTAYQSTFLRLSQGFLLLLPSVLDLTQQ